MYSFKEPVRHAAGEDQGLWRGVFKLCFVLCLAQNYKNHKYECKCTNQNESVFLRRAFLFYKALIYNFLYNHYYVNAQFSSPPESAAEHSIQTKTKRLRTRHTKVT